MDFGPSTESTKIRLCSLQSSRGLSKQYVLVSTRFTGSGERAFFGFALHFEEAGYSGQTTSAKIPVGSRRHVLSFVFPSVAFSNFWSVSKNTRRFSRRLYCDIPIDPDLLHDAQDRFSRRHHNQQMANTGFAGCHSVDIRRQFLDRLCSPGIRRFSLANFLARHHHPNRLRFRLGRFRLDYATGNRIIRSIRCLSRVILAS